jgi:hypothetical protein
MKKKLAILLTVLMVLTAVAPSFAATIIVDQPPVGQDEALDELIMLGVLKERRGDDYLKRQDTVVLLSRLMDQEDQANVYPINHPFNDVSDSFYNGYLGWAYANQYFMGKSGTEFGFGEFMTVQQLQIVLLRSLGYYLGEFPGWDAVAATANTMGFGTNLTGTALSSRGTMATMTTAAIRANYKGTNETLAARLGHEVKTKADNEQLNILSFTQVGPKIFELECDEDISALENSIQIKRGNITNSIEKITFPTYGKETARIEMTSNIMDTNYTALITDKKGQVLSATIAGERPYLADILITSSTAKLLGYSGTDANKVIVNYETVDQFDNDINASVNWSGSGSVSDKGSYLEIYSSSAWQIGQVVMITGIAQVTGKAPVVVNDTLKVSEPRKAVSIQLGEIENLDEDPDDEYPVQGSNDVWGIPVIAIDQEGDEITDIAYFGSKNSPTSNNVILSPSDGTLVWYYPSSSQVADGKEEQVYVRVYASSFAENTVPTTVYVNLVDKNSGASDSTIVELLPNGVNKFIVDEPDMVVAGTPVEFLFEAYNYVGDQVENYDTLKDSIYVNGIKLTKGEKDGFYWVEKAGGDAKLMYKNTNTSATTQFTDYATFMANSSNPYQVNFVVYPKANPYAIAGLDDEIYEFYAVDNKTIQITEDELLYEDQYGYDYDGSMPSGYYIQFTGDGDISGDEESIELDLSDATTYDFEAELYNNDDELLDVISFTIRVLDADDIDRFEVTNIGKIYAPDSADSSTYGKKVEVLGYEGKDPVKLPSNVIQDIDAITHDEYLKTDVPSKLVFATSIGGALDDDISCQLIVKYNINGQVNVEQQTVTVSPDEPYATDVDIYGKEDANLSGSTLYVDAADVVDGLKLILTDEYDADASYSGYFDAFFEITDQYGVVSDEIVNYMYVNDNTDYGVDNSNYTLEVEGTPQEGDEFTIVCGTTDGTTDRRTYLYVTVQ